VAVKNFHLAFKGMDSGEVYDVLMEQFLMAVAKYDHGEGQAGRGVHGK
jgi:hypothetical protein